jgi:uncharacterized protein YdaU (DUF1376 family)
MNNRTWMPLNIGDYRKDTGHLRAAGHGGYLLLIMHYWSTGGLPTDNRQLAAIANMSWREWKEWGPVLQKFFHHGWRHKRIDAEIASANERYERRARAGSKGGKATRNVEQCLSNASALLPQSTEYNKKEDITPDGVSTKYVFESGIIRLNEKSFNDWKDAFSHLDLKAELTGLTSWADQQGNRWFFAVSGALAKRNREMMTAAQQAKSAPAFRWNGPIEGVV